MTEVALQAGFVEYQAMYEIFMADDHALLRSGMKSFLESSGDFTIKKEACDGIELLDLLKRGEAPDALILDLTMPGMSGIETMENIRRMGLDFKILVLTMHKEPELLCHSFRAGANGYMLKEGITRELLRGVHAVLEGEIYVSPSMIIELPDTCNLKAFHEKVPPFEFSHCRR